MRYCLTKPTRYNRQVTPQFRYELFSIALEEILFFWFQLLISHTYVTALRPNHMMSLVGSVVLPAATVPPDIKTDIQYNLIRKGVATLAAPLLTFLPEVPST
jgi:hypothetical protein